MTRLTLNVQHNQITTKTATTTPNLTKQHNTKQSIYSTRLLTASEEGRAGDDLVKGQRSHHWGSRGGSCSHAWWTRNMQNWDYFQGALLWRIKISSILIGTKCTFNGANREQSTQKAYSPHWLTELFIAHSHRSISVGVVHDGVEGLIRHLPEDHRGDGLVEGHHAAWKRKVSQLKRSCSQ